MAWSRQDIGTFVLVCGDRDFIPIVKRLQQKGREVHIIGLRASTSRDLQNFVGQNYMAVEELLGIIPAKGQAAPPDPAIRFHPRAFAPSSHQWRGGCRSYPFLTS